MNEKNTGTVTVEVDPKNPPALTEEELKQLDSLRNMRDEEIDTSDIPPLRGRFWRRPGLEALGAEARRSGVLLDADVLQFFSREGNPDRAEVNRVLREYIAAHIEELTAH